MKFRIKIQQIDGDEKKTVFDETCKGYFGMMYKDDKVGGEFGANISDATIGDLIMASPHMMEIHKMITAYEIAKHLGYKDPEDELADRIGGTLQ